MHPRLLARKRAVLHTRLQDLEFMRAEAMARVDRMRRSLRSMQDTGLCIDFDKISSALEGILAILEGFDPVRESHAEILLSVAHSLEQMGQAFGALNQALRGEALAKAIQ